MIKKFKKKPIIVDAVQWNGDNTEEIEEFRGEKLKKQMSFDGTKIIMLIIPTLEGMHEASIGDYIIKGIKNEFYPIKPDILKLTYEEVNE